MHSDPAQTRPLSASRSLWRAMEVLGDEPVGILLASAVSLGTHAVFLLWLQVASQGMPLPTDDPEPWRRLLLQAGGLWLLGAVLRSLLRGWIWWVGAGSLGRRRPRGIAAVGAWGSMWLVDLLISTLSWLIWGMGLLPASMAAFILLGHGVITGSVLCAALGLVIAAALSLMVRVFLAYCPVFSLLDGAPPWTALASGWRAARGDRLRLMGVLLAGDLLTGIGGLLCLAGALPGHPVGPLAVLVRWDARAPQPPDHASASARADT